MFPSPKTSETLKEMKKKLQKIPSQLTDTAICHRDIHHGLQFNKYNMFINAREWHRLLLLRRVKRFIRFLFSFQIKSFVLNSIYTFSLLNVTNKIDFMKTFLVIISKFDYPYITIGITAAYYVVPFKRHWIKRKSLDLLRWGFKLKSTNLFGYFKDNCCKQ